MTADLSFRYASFGSEALRVLHQRAVAVCNCGGTDCRRVAGGLFDSARMESGASAEDDSSYGNAAGSGNFWSGVREQHPRRIVVDHDFDYGTVHCGAGGMVDAVIDRAERKRGDGRCDYEFEQSDCSDFGSDRDGLYRYGDEELFGSVCCGGDCFGGRNCGVCVLAG